MRVVLDCNVLLQGLSNPSGPSGGCVTAAEQGVITLCVSRALMREFEDVASRPQIMKKPRLSDLRATAFISSLTSFAVMTETVPHVDEHPVDPKDTMIVNLTIAANAHVITSRERHLLALRDPSDPVGAAFLAKFRHIEVLTPVELLERLHSM